MDEKIRIERLKPKVTPKIGAVLSKFEPNLSQTVSSFWRFHIRNFEDMIFDFCSFVLFFFRRNDRTTLKLTPVRLM